MVSPNPSDGNLHINAFLPEKSVVNFTIYDVCGKKYEINENKILQKGKHLLNLYFGNVPNGIYFLKIETKKNIQNKIVIINK